ncbi:MAG: integration host factor subunit alpha [Gammaproteobacteria bacterium]|nr:MAG: integration host factor subunit alpha [Gammaproteobacteria bacterium]|tara:strand:- start:300 stop:593 length:294 start_codon:yes stop_codon:yes gene_type:complete
MNKTLTKKDIVNHLNKEIGLSKTESKLIVEGFFDQIKEALSSGEEVKISGFGNFELINKKERPGRNPKTGEEVIVSARRVVTFRSGRKLRKRISLDD